MQEAAPPLSQGRYRLLDILGSGGMATVYRAWDTRLEVVRAIKVLAPHLTSQESLRTRFESEARTMARLHHRNLVTIHDVDADGDRVFMVMELVEGGSLMDLVLFRGRLGGAESLAVMEAVLKALAAAHDKGVVHRDVKPHNVLLDRDGTPKVTDFGIARVSDSGHTRTGAVMGTWAYMAPEQRVDARSVDARADVFAAGATLYVMVTGKEPFDLYATDLEDEVFGDVEPEVAEVIKGATRYRVEERYPSAEAMLAALRAARHRLDPHREAVLPVPDVEPLPLPDLSALAAVGGLATGLHEVPTHELPSPTFTIEPPADSDTLAPPSTQATVIPTEDEAPRRGLGAILAAGGAMVVLVAVLVVVVGGVGAGAVWWSLRSDPSAPEQPPVEVVEAPDEELPPVEVEPPIEEELPAEAAPPPERRAPPGKPAPSPEPVYTPPAPPSGHVDVSGAASRVFLVRGKQSVDLPGDVPVGTWSIYANFTEGGDTVLAGQVTVVEGGAVHLVCKAGFMRCVSE